MRWVRIARLAEESARSTAYPKVSVTHAADLRTARLAVALSAILGAARWGQGERVVALWREAVPFAAESFAAAGPPATSSPALTAPATPPAPAPDRR